MKKTLSIMTVLAVCIACVFMLPFGRMSTQAAKAGLSTNQPQLLIDDQVGTGSSLTLSSYSKTYAGDTFSGSFKVYSSARWTASVTSGSWLHLNTTGGSGNGTVSFALEPNFSGSTRTGTIRVRLAGNSSVYKDYKVIHNSKSWSISLDRERVNLNYEGGYCTVTVNSDVPWKCELKNVSYPDTSWIELYRTAGSAGKTTVGFRVAENKTGLQRQATIRFSGTGAGLGITKDVKVNQIVTYEDAPDIYIGYPTTMENEYSLNKFNQQAVDRVVDIYDNYVVHYDSYIIVQFKDEPYGQSIGHSHNVTSTSQFAVDYAHSSRPANKWWCTSDGRHTLKCHFACPPTGTPILEINCGYFKYRIHFTNFTMSEGPVWMRAINTGDPWGGQGTHTGSQESGEEYWKCALCGRLNLESYSSCPCGGFKTWKCNLCGNWTAESSNKCFMCGNPRKH